MRIGVHQIDRLDETTVALGIDLERYPELRNQRVLRVAMDKYIAALPNLKGMAAAIRGNELTIVARGDIDEDMYTHITESMKNGSPD